LKLTWYVGNRDGEAAYALMSDLRVGWRISRNSAVPAWSAWTRRAARALTDPRGQETMLGIAGSAGWAAQIRAGKNSN
jgi:hypothetical protein